MSDSWVLCWVLQMSSRAAPARAPTPAWAPPASARRTPLRCAFGTTSLMTTGRSTTSAAASGNTETTFHNSQFSAGGSRTPDSQVGNLMPAALGDPRGIFACADAKRVYTGASSPASLRARSTFITITPLVNPARPLPSFELRSCQRCSPVTSSEITIVSSQVLK